MKTRRQGAILDLVDREAITSQEQLRKRLQARGLAATQATLSRDIRDLALVKRSADGAYQRPPADLLDPPAGAAVLQRRMAEYLRGTDRVAQLVVLRTGPAQAQPLAIAIDRARLPEVVGTIGGDDTILVIARDVARARALVRRFERAAKR